MLKLGAYLRMSPSPQGPKDANLDAQLEDCHAEAERRGGRIVEVYRDSEQSAFKQTRVTLPDGTTVLRNRRPDFQRLMGDLYAGTIDGFVGYHLDRIARQPRDLEDLIDLVTLKRVKVFGMASDIDLSTDQGILSARLAVMIANQSSRDTSRRVTRKWAALQEAGKPGGGPLPFGWEPDRVTVHPGHAAAISDAVERLTGGATLSAIVKGWNTQGLVTSKGNPWTSPGLKQLLKSPRIAGIRARRSGRGWETVKDGAGNAVQGKWEPIVTPAQFDALQAVLDANTATYRGGQRDARRYLLSGITRCGACGHAMVGQINGNGHAYVCPSPSQGGCGKVARSGPRLDAIAETAIREALGAILRDATQPVGDWVGQADLTRVEGLLADSLQAWKAGNLPSADYFTLRGDLDRERKALTRAQSDHATAVAVRATSIDGAAKWDSLSIQERHDVARSLLVAIVIDPLPVVDGRKIKAWNPDLFHFEWRA